MERYGFVARRESLWQWNAGQGGGSAEVGKVTLSAAHLTAHDCQLFIQVPSVLRSWFTGAEELKIVLIQAAHTCTNQPMTMITI